MSDFPAAAKKVDDSNDHNHEDHADAPKTQVTIEEAIEFVKDHAEQLAAQQLPIMPSLTMYRATEYQGRISFRLFEPEDRSAAFTEACTLIPYLKADQVIFMNDVFAPHTHSGKTSPREGLEAIVVLLGDQRGAEGWILTYERASDGTITWLPNEPKLPADLIMSYQTGSMASFLQHDTNTVHFDALVRTLRKSGHRVELAEAHESRL